MDSLWKNRDRDIWAFYCPQCKTQRKVPGRPNPATIKHLLQIGLTSVVFTLATWPVFGLKGLVSFIPIWAAFETLYRTRFRAHVSCPHCGFDPFLYLSNIKRARGEIEDYWRKKFEEKGIAYPEKASPEAARGKMQANASIEDSVDSESDSRLDSPRN